MHNLRLQPPLPKGGGSRTAADGGIPIFRNERKPSGALARTPPDTTAPQRVRGGMFRMKQIYSLPCQREVAVARRLTEGFPFSEMKENRQGRQQARPRHPPPAADARFGQNSCSSKLITAPSESSATSRSLGLKRHAKQGN